MTSMGVAGEAGSPNPEMRLSGRRILITGGSSGIGRATAELFCSHGASVGILDRDPAPEELAKRLAAVAIADVADPDAAARGVNQVAEELGGLDGVVNNAGISPGISFRDTDVSVWRRVMSINLDGVFYVCSAAMPWLEREETATIVTIASGQALIPSSAAVAYSASKAGAAYLTKAISRELGPKIRANVVCPGIVETPLMRSYYKEKGDEQFAKDMSRYVVDRLASPRELADAVLFLTSDESSYIYGVTLSVDGGRTFH